MTPDKLSASSFAGYSPEAMRFASEHLALLQRLPLVLCPSFLQQMQGVDTLFPSERNLLRWQCDSLAKMPRAQFTQLTTVLASLSTPESLRGMDWVSFPARFVTEFTAYLWSSGQLNTFRKSAAELFAAIPPSPGEDVSRLVAVILGQGATVDPARVLKKLRARGVTLTSLDFTHAFKDLGALLKAHQAKNADPYGTWYVDGGQAHSELVSALGEHATVVSYAGLGPIREHVLQRVQATIATGSSGPEQMRTRLMETSVMEAGARQVTTDPVLQRFYTELFTESSGPQIFSTSFVQWTGRELARRAQPRTMLLRYAPRQHHQDMNAMFAETALKPDPQGSLRDAEMGAYYNWIEMSRITAAGRLTFVAWVEGQSLAVIVARGAPAGVVTASPMTLAQALDNFA